MVRTLALLLTAMSPMIAFSATPFQAGGVPGAKKTQSEPGAARKLIDAIQADFDRAATDLNRNDPSAQTRQAQKRIIEGLDKLLDPPDQPEGSASKSPPPRSPATGSKKPSPAPSIAPAKAQKSPALPTTSKQVGQKPGANTPAAVRNLSSTDGPWPNLPPRHRGEVDAHARERFIRNYDDILRQYYRVLGENDRRRTDKE